MAQDKFWKFAAKKLAEENIEIEDLSAAASQAADDYFLEIQETGADWLWSLAAAADYSDPFKSLSICHYMPL